MGGLTCFWSARDYCLVAPSLHSSGGMLTVFVAIGEQNLQEAGDDGYEGTKIGHAASETICLEDCGRVNIEQMPL